MHSSLYPHKQALTRLENYHTIIHFLPCLQNCNITSEISAVHAQSNPILLTSAVDCWAD